VNTPSREIPVDPAHAALLIIDVQNYCVHANGAGLRELNARQRKPIPNLPIH